MENRSKTEDNTQETNHVSAEKTKLSQEPSEPSSTQPDLEPTELRPEVWHESIDYLRELIKSTQIAKQGEKEPYRQYYETIDHVGPSTDRAVIAWYFAEYGGRQYNSMPWMRREATLDVKKLIEGTCHVACHQMLGEADMDLCERVDLMKRFKTLEGGITETWSRVGGWEFWLDEVGYRSRSPFYGGGDAAEMDDLGGTAMSSAD